MTIGIFKEWLVKYFFVHKIVLKAILVFYNNNNIVTVCVFVCHMFSYHPFCFDFHSAHVIFDVSFGFYFWNVVTSVKNVQGCF